MNFDAAVDCVSSCMTEPPSEDAIRAAHAAVDEDINKAVDFLLGVMSPGSAKGQIGSKLMNQRRVEKPEFAEQRAALMAKAQPGLFLN